MDRPLAPERTEARPHHILRLDAYQLRCLTRVPAHAVSTSAEQAGVAIRVACADLLAAPFVESVLSRHPEVRRDTVPGTVSDALLAPPGDLHSLPQRDGIDGG